MFHCGGSLLSVGWIIPLIFFVGTLSTLCAPVTEHVPLHSKSRCKNMARAFEGGTNGKDPIPLSYNLFLSFLSHFKEFELHWRSCLMVIFSNRSSVLVVAVIVGIWPLGVVGRGDCVHFFVHGCC